MIPGSMASMMFGGLDLNPKTVTYLAAMDSQPSAAQITLINNLVNSLETNSLWSLFDHFYLLMMHADQPSRVNLINPGTDTLSLSGSPTFSANSGWTGAASGYLQTATGMNAFSVFSQNSAHLGIFCETNVAANTGAIGNVSNGNEIRPYSPGLGQLSVITGTYAGSGSYRSLSTSAGHSIVTRGSSSANKQYRDASELTPDNSNTSVAVNSATLKIVGGINGTNGVKASIAHCGANLSGANVTALYSILTTYRAGVAAL